MARGHTWGRHPGAWQLLLCSFSRTRLALHGEECAGPTLACPIRLRLPFPFLSAPPFPLPLGATRLHASGMADLRAAVTALSTNFLTNEAEGTVLESGSPILISLAAVRAMVARSYFFLNLSTLCFCAYSEMETTQRAHILQSSMTVSWVVIAVGFASQLVICWAPSHFSRMGV